MNTFSTGRFGWLLHIAASCVITCAVDARAQDTAEAEPAASLHEGPSAALEFEQSFRDSEHGNQGQPVRLDRCENITELTKDLWSKKDVLTDFKKHRTPEQLGVIVIVKTELCCEGSRLCAVTTACMEKKSTPLVGRFRVYAGWIKSNPDHPQDEWSQWERDVIREYSFVQGPGARVVVMLPTWDGKMYQWHSTATKLDLTESAFKARHGETPKLESFLQTSLDFAPATIPSSELSQN